MKASETVVKAVQKNRKDDRKTTLDNDNYNRDALPKSQDTAQNSKKTPDLRFSSQDVRKDDEDRLRQPTAETTVATDKAVVATATAHNETALNFDTFKIAQLYNTTTLTHTCHHDSQNEDERAAASTTPALNNQPHPLTDQEAQVETVETPNSIAQLDDEDEVMKS